MSKFKGIKCDVCGKEINYNFYNGLRHIFFPIKFRVMYHLDYGEDNSHDVKHMCMKCFDLFEKFVKEVDRRKKNVPNGDGNSEE